MTISSDNEALVRRIELAERSKSSKQPSGDEKTGNQVTAEISKRLKKREHEC